MRKRLSAMLLALSLIVSASVSIYAYENPEPVGTWQHDNNGWWYLYEDGTYPHDGWTYIGDHEYYFYGSGYMAHDTWMDEFYLGSDGRIITNTFTPDGYYVGNEHYTTFRSLMNYPYSTYRSYGYCSDVKFPTSYTIQVGSFWWFEGPGVSKDIENHFFEFLLADDAKFLIQYGKSENFKIVNKEQFKEAVKEFPYNIDIYLEDGRVRSVSHLHY